MTLATYIATDSAQFKAGTAGYLSDATSRRVWFSLDATGGRGCYVHPCDVADQSQMDRARDAQGEHEDILDAARAIVAIDLATDCAEVA